MKTKQLLEIALKITGIIFFIPGLLVTPMFFYSGVEILDRYSGAPNPLLLPLLIYILIIRYLIFRTDKVVNLIYKEKEDETDIVFNFNRRNTIYLALVLSSLFGLIVTVPSFLVELAKGIKNEYDIANSGALHEFRYLLLDQRKSLWYFVVEGSQILLMFLLMTNATRVTAWVEASRKKKMQKGALNNEDEDS